VQLIQRSTRTLSLTAEGQAYYERVAPLLRSIEEAEDVVQTASEAKGLLRVSAPQEFGRVLIARWAPEFLARHPRKLVQAAMKRSTNETNARALVLARRPAG
jgi:DNA-binding transcriptional LysR family regulator